MLPGGVRALVSVGEGLQSLGASRGVKKGCRGTGGTHGGCRGDT